MIFRFLNWIAQFFERLFQRSFEFFSKLLGGIFQTLFNFLKKLLQPIFVLIAVILYVIYKIGEVFVYLVKLFLAIGKMLIMFVKGIVATLAGFTYTPKTPSNGKWTPIFKHVVNDGLHFMQLDAVAYILLFSIFFGTAMAVIKIISTMRNN